jgi:hypothetical protein
MSQDDYHDHGGPGMRPRPRIVVPVTETQAMRDQLTTQQRFAAVIDVMRQTLEEIAVDEFYVPRLTWSPRSWWIYWRDRWRDRFQPHRTCMRLRSGAARALDEVAELTGQPWRGLTRVTPVRPRLSPYKRPGEL